MTDDGERKIAGGGADGDAAARAREGVDHLQTAARELIRAARSLLDAAERVVDDPQAVTGVANQVAGLVAAAAKGLTSTADDERDDPGRGDRVERIEVG